jgi:hypothetical protein
MASTLEWARRYVTAGLSVIPVRADGSKAPVFADWRQYTDRLATDDELAKWFDGTDYGLGVVPGPASGNLAVFDFENRNGVSAFDLWVGGLTGAEKAALVSCPIVVTPSGGRHVWVRSAVPHRGKVLARDDAGLILIEIRGVGHQVLAPGCPAKCHKSGKEYTFAQRGWLPQWN